MAGEFPDRSKQRESSAEPTSGSASPVPEARGEVRDPRLAVARDTEPPVARGGVDTATRVFSARDVAQARAAAQDSKPTPPGTPDEDTTAEGPQDAEPTDGAEGAAGSAEAGAGVPGAAEDAKEAPVTEDVQDAVPTEGGPAKDAEDVQDAVPSDSTASARDAGTSAAAGESASAGAESPTGAADASSGVSEGAVAGGGSVKGAKGAGDAAVAEDVQDAVPTDSAEGAEDAPVAEDVQDAVPGDGAELSRDAEASAAPEETSPAEAESAAGAAEAGAGVSKGARDAAAAEDVQDAVPAEGSQDVEASAAPEETSPAEVESAAGAAEAGAGVSKGARDAAAAEDVQDAVPAEGSRDVEASAAPEDKSPAGAEDVQDAVPAEGSRDAEGSATADGAVGEPGGDARLRAAVAAWVRSGDSPGAADSGAKDGERPASAAKADPRATTSPSDAVGAREESAQAARGTAGPNDAADARGGSAQAARAAVDPSEAGDAREGSAGPSGAVDAREGSGQGTREPGEKADEPGPEARVDQPTTMLKLPSKFVALKPDVTTAIPQVGPERTTQQPLPPKPPLDLLAELTNTPPPPQTPLRTTFRRVKIWTPLVLLLAVVFAVAQAMRPLPTPTLELTAEDSYSFDGSKVDIPWPAEGQAALDVQGIGSFGSSGDQKPVPIASVAKVMTAYVILRDHPLKSGAAGPKIKIDQTAEAQSKAGQESTVNVTAGDSISQREALESILIASANNVARLLARWDAGSEKAFVEKMNAAAEDLGMTNTTYTDPSGLNNTTVSTAVDQVKLGKKAMEEPAFREVAAMMSYDDYKGVNHPNWNQIVGKNNVVGIKTGTTTSALGNLLFAAKKEVNGETRTIVGAVVRQPAGGVDNTILSAALTAGDRLIRAAQGALESATILKKGDVVGYVDDGLGGRTPVVATKDVTAVGWSGLTVKLTFAADDVPHTAKAGTKVGTLTVGDASAGAVKVPVALQKDLVEPGFTDKLTRIT
ncbi:D-alanyl-D-alanine carboxypeptidase [Streptomyces sp. NPDC051001]|uniref:D-alanyl-D-alanine carboxypeptidase n=1 Tax=Streptomyces sp. NPDC051001 TaxID=3155795 RepID=UPI00342CCA3F